MKPSLNTEVLVQKITEVVSELSWMSETDAPFEVLHWTAQDQQILTPQQVLNQAQLPLQTPVEVLTLDSFLTPVIEPQPWHTEADVRVTQQFQALQTLLEQMQNPIQVYRCGTTELEIYIVSQVQDSDWLVLHTTAVET